MKRFMNSFVAIIGIVLMTALSCTKELADATDLKKEKHTCTMKLVGSIVDYDVLNTKAEANATTWADGSVIYLKMESPLGTTNGEAVYNAVTEAWTISYYGSLYEGLSNACTALYFDNKVSSYNSIITLDEGTIIYEDLEGSYLYNGGDLVVTANLKPKTGRIRFSGTEGSVIKVFGVTHYTTYNLATDNYTTSDSPFKITVKSDGYTPYCYGYFTDTQEPNIKLWIDAKEAYTRYCSKDIFNAGQSGKMSIPSADSHNGWIDGLHFNYKNAKFKMVAVEGGSFIMGDPNSSDVYYTPHRVTLTGYCMGETEITQELIGDDSEDKRLPVLDSHRFSDIIERLNQKLGLSFSLPSEAQWEFAAKGGVKSKGYKYSGSNNIDDVAWHDVGLKEVKQKLPNELGIYDMSGNAIEWTRDIFGKFTTISVVDPIVTKGQDLDFFCLRGGEAIDNKEANYTNVARCSDFRNSRYGGRLVLNWN